MVGACIVCCPFSELSECCVFAVFAGYAEREAIYSLSCCLERCDVTLIE